MRASQGLAAMRFATPETADVAAPGADSAPGLAAPHGSASAPASAAKSVLAPAASEPPARALTLSAQVLVTLDEVLSAPGPGASESIDASRADATDATDATDETEARGSLEAAIAARQEVKRMKLRARAEQAAAARAARVNPFGGERQAVLDQALDRVRGGFVTNNLNIAFGIERAVYINGILVTTTSLNISDTGRITNSTDSKALAPGALALIQSGTGNSVAGGAFSSGAGLGLSASAIGTVVQNTLDGQKIQNVTVINATANSLGVLRGLNLQNSLRNSLIDSLRR